MRGEERSRKRRDKRGETNQRLVEAGTRVVPGSANRQRRPPLRSGPIHRAGPEPSRARSREDREILVDTPFLCSPLLSTLSSPFSRNVCKRHGPWRTRNDRPIIHAPPRTENQHALFKKRDLWSRGMFTGNLFERRCSTNEKLIRSGRFSYIKQIRINRVHNDCIEKKIFTSYVCNICSIPQIHLNSQKVE